MSEFKFACPVCGQHITADSSSSGTHLECPTCFRKIVVPQAPGSTESKFILSAAQADKPRPLPMAAQPGVEPVEKATEGKPLGVVAAVAGFLVVAALAGGGWWWQHDKAARRAAVEPPVRTNAPAPKPVPPAPVVYPVPTNIVWTVDAAKMVIPEETAVGRIRGRGFRCERAQLQGGSLTLRQGKSWPPDLGFTVNLFARHGEDLSGKTIEIKPDRSPAPMVMLRWKDDQQKPATRKFTTGYALKVVFGQPAKGRMPGSIYIALPDEGQSFAAGTFNAEIRAPSPPHKPKGPPPPKSPPPQTIQTQTPPAELQPPLPAK